MSTSTRSPIWIVCSIEPDGMTNAWRRKVFSTQGDQQRHPDQDRHLPYRRPAAAPLDPAGCLRRSARPRGAPPLAAAVPGCPPGPPCPEPRPGSEPPPCPWVAAVPGVRRRAPGSRAVSARPAARLPTGPARERARAAKPAGRCSARIRPSGQPIQSARPITLSTGTVPPPGSPRWSRESLESPRWSPITHSCAGRDDDVERDLGRGVPGVEVVGSSTGSPVHRDPAPLVAADDVVPADTHHPLDVVRLVRLGQPHQAAGLRAAGGPPDSPRAAPGRRSRCRRRRRRRRAADRPPKR